MQPNWNPLAPSFRLAAIACILLTANLPAQVTQGTIAGTVTDPNAAAVPGCHISVTRSSTGEKRSTVTSSNGSYSVASLPPGEFTVSVEAKGFKTTTARVTVQIDQTATVDFHLTLGEVTETVETRETAPALELERDSHEISGTLSAFQLENLPSNGRSFLTLVTQMAGAQSGSEGTGGNGSSSFFSSLGRDIVLSGQSVGHAEFLQDGVANVNLLTQAGNIIADLESIQEVRIEINGMSARFAEPGNINVITKSGTNSIHGTLYDYLRNDDLNARGFFAPTRSPIRSNQFGANLGAPILRNKLFAFFDYAGQRQNAAATKNARVPTAAELTGNFGSTTIYDPTTYNATAGTISPFPNNTIPPSQINPYSQKYLTFYPAASGPVVNGNNFVANVPTTANNDQYLGKVDYNVSSHDTLSGSIQTASTPALSPSINPNYFGIENNIDGDNAYVQETHIVSPQIVNIGRFGYNRSVLFRTQQAAGTQNFAALFGLQNLDPQPDQSAPPLVTISGLGTGLGDPNSPQGATQNLYQFADEVNWTLGRHQLFFGLDVKYYQFDGNWTVNNNGTYTFNGQYVSNHKTGSALTLGPGLADFLLGFPSAATDSQGITVANYREFDVAGYFQDNWKLTPGLTLNIGLRYEFHQPPNDISGHASTFLYYQNVNAPGTWKPNYLDFAPRVGLAWSANAKTVIRAGYGIYYNSTPYNYLQFDLTHPPNYYAQSISEGIAAPVAWQNTFSANPLTSSSQPFTLGETMKDPYVEQWNLNIQRTIGARALFTVGYVGNESHHQSIRLNANQAVPSTNPSLAANQTTAAINSRRPYPYLGDVYAQFNIANADYNALISELHYRLSKSLSFQTAYTWSKAMDVEDSDQVSAILTGQNLRLSHGPAGFDRRHNFRANFTYELPFLRKNRYLGGWQVTGLYALASGLPYSATASDVAYIGGVHGSFANRTCSGIPTSGRNQNNWLTTSCFSQPTAGILGNAGRNDLREGDSNDLDLALFKRFRFGETRFVELRSDFFNVFNHPSFTIGSTSYQSVASSTFGKLTSASDPRTIQLGLKIAF